MFRAMAIAALQTILDRIGSWPEDRQEEAAELLAALESRRGEDDLQVSDEDLAEIDRRMSDPTIRRLSLDEFDARMDRVLRR
jgi:hypothetical protein